MQIETGKKNMGKYTTEQLESIATKLRSMPSIQKNKREHDEREAVKNLSKEITVLQKRGYTFDQISEALCNEGMNVSTHTLKSYLSCNNNEDIGAVRLTVCTLIALFIIVAAITWKQMSNGTAAVKPTIANQRMGDDVQGVFQHAQTFPWIKWKSAGAARTKPLKSNNGQQSQIASRPNKSGN